MAESAPNGKDRIREHRITLRETLYGTYVILGLIWFFLFGVFDTVEFKLLDLRFQFRKYLQNDLGPDSPWIARETFPKEKIFIVGIDPKSVSLIGTKSIPRAAFGRVIDNLCKFGVRTIGLDVIFSTLEDPKDDDLFADSLRRNGDRVVLGGDAIETTVLGAKSLQPNFPAEKFQQPGVAIGLVNMYTEIDSFCRTIPLVNWMRLSGKGDGKPLGEISGTPSLSARIAARYLGLGAELEALCRRTAEIDLRQFRLGSIEIQSGPNHTILVNFTGGPGTFREIPLADAMRFSELEKRVLPVSFDVVGDQIRFENERRKAEIEIGEETLGTGSIRGRVVGLLPLDEIEVNAVSPVQRLHATGRVGADGNFEITGLKSGFYRLNVRRQVRDGRLTGAIQTFAGVLDVRDGAVTDGVRIALPAGDRRLKFTVTGGEPATADRRTYRFDLDRARYVAKTGPDGRFAFAGLPTGPAVITAALVDLETFESIELAPRSRQRFMGAAQPDTPYNIVQRVEDGTIVGRILARDGAGIADAQVIAFQPQPDDSPLFKHDFVLVDRTDAQGGFRLGRIEDDGDYYLSVTLPVKGGPGAATAAHLFIEREAVSVRVGTAAPTAEAPADWLTLADEDETPGRYAGRVLSRDGRPVEGAAVTVVFGKCTAKLQLAATDVEHGATRELARLLPGEYTVYGEDLVAAPDAGLASKLQMVNLSESPSRDLTVGLAEIRNQRGPASLGGVFRPAAGAPPGEVTIRLVGEGGGTVATSRVAPDGRFAFPNFPAGMYNVVSERRDGRGLTACGIGTLGGLDLRGAIVLIGSWNPLARDFYPTPFNFDPLGIRTEEASQMFGVEVHAHTVHTLLNNAGITRTSKMVNLALMTGLTFALMVWLQRFSFAGMFFSIAGAAAAYASAALLAFVKYRIWVNLFMPLFGLLAIYLFAVGFRYQTEQRKKRQIKGIFEKMVPKSVVDQVLMHDGAAKVSGKREYLTILFSDIRGFTPMSESMTPEQVVDILNEYMGEMTKIIFKNRGTLDKFIGDAIMVIFGAPIPFEDHAYCAVKSAVEMLQKLLELRSKWGAEGKYQINVGIGINTGDVVVGNMGSEERMNYTVIGDNVNLSARLEANTKGGQILISAETFKHVKDRIIYEKPDPIKVKGKSMLITIYDVKGLKEQQMGAALPTQEVAQTVLPAGKTALPTEEKKTEAAKPPETVQLVVVDKPAAEPEKPAPAPAPPAPPAAVKP